jgi:hypothetical protein
MWVEDMRAVSLYMHGAAVWLAWVLDIWTVSLAHVVVEHVW